MKYTISKEHILFLILFYTLIFNEPLVDLIPYFGYEDELIAVLAVPLFVLRRWNSKGHKDSLGVFPWLAAFVACGLVGSLIYNYQPFFEAALPDVLLCLKFWMCIYASKELFRHYDIDKYGRRILWHVKLLTWFFLGLTVLNMVLDLYPYYDIRYGFESSSLFYEHPVTLVAVCVFLIVLLLGLKQYTKHSFFYFALLAFVMCTTLRSKALASVILFLMIYYFIAVKKQRFSLKHVVFLLPALVVIGWSQIEYYFFTMSDASARSMLLMTGFEIAADHMPFGAGFGTYGSHYSAVFYSPLYSTYGLNTIHGLNEGGAFICDSFWPMIMGQTGYLGLCFFLIAVIILISEVSKLRQYHLNYYVSGLASVIYLLIDSMTSTAFVHPLSMPIAIWLGILLAKRKSSVYDMNGIR